MYGKIIENVKVDQENDKIFTNKIKVYENNQVWNAILVIVSSYIFIFDNQGEKVIGPFNFLEDITKFIYSELYQNYFAFKMKDIKKSAGRGDHIICIIDDRDLLA